MGTCTSRIAGSQHVEARPRKPSDAAAEEFAAGKQRGSIGRVAWDHEDGRNRTASEPGVRDSAHVSSSPLGPQHPRSGVGARRHSCSAAPARSSSSLASSDGGLDRHHPRAVGGDSATRHPLYPGAASGIGSGETGVHTFHAGDLVSTASSRALAAMVGPLSRPGNNAAAAARPNSRQPVRAAAAAATGTTAGRRSYDTSNGGGARGMVGRRSCGDGSSEARMAAEAAEASETVALPGRQRANGPDSVDPFAVSGRRWDNDHRNGSAQFRGREESVSSQAATCVGGAADRVWVASSHEIRSPGQRHPPHLADAPMYDSIDAAAEAASVAASVAAAEAAIREEEEEEARAAAVAAAAAAAREAAGPASVQWVIRPGPPVESVYKLGAVLGRGSFGIVRAATHLLTGAEVAVKTIDKPLLAAADVSALRREVEILHHLSGHPHISQLLGVFEEPTQLHLVLEMYRGGDLFDAIISVGRHSERAAADVMRTVLTGIAYCHAMGVAHRDIKPENFMLTVGPPEVDDNDDDDDDDGKESAAKHNEEENTRGAVGSRLKLIDFGLSVFCTDATPLTETVGTSYYVAPEVLAGAYHRAADVWSAGVILHIMLAGYAPFDGRSDDEILRAVLKGDLDLTTDPIWTSVSREAVAALTAMLQRDPAKRATADQLLAMPWFGRTAAACSAPSAPLPGVVSERMRRFARMNSFKKEARRVVAGLMRREEVAGLVAQFHALDTNGDGKLSVQELKDGLARQELRLGDVGSAAMTEHELVELLARSDLDGDGQLDESDFIGATLPATAIKRKAQHALAAAAASTTAAKAAAAARAAAGAGKNGSRAASAAGRAARAVSAATRAAASVASRPGSAGGASALLAAAFAHFDADGSGYITEDELRQALAAHHPSGRTEGPDIKALMAQFDTDGDGRIDYLEFLEMMVEDLEEEGEDGREAEAQRRAAADRETAEAEGRKRVSYTGGRPRSARPGTRINGADVARLAAAAASAAAQAQAFEAQRQSTETSVPADASKGGAARSGRSGRSGGRQRKVTMATEAWAGLDIGMGSDVAAAAATATAAAAMCTAGADAASAAAPGGRPSSRPKPSSRGGTASSSRGGSNYQKHGGGGGGGGGGGLSRSSTSCGMKGATSGRTSPLDWSDECESEGDDDDDAAICSDSAAAATAAATRPDALLRLGASRDSPGRMHRVSESSALSKLAATGGAAGSAGSATAACDRSRGKKNQAYHQQHQQHLQARVHLTGPDLLEHDVSVCSVAASSGTGPHGSRPASRPPPLLLPTQPAADLRAHRHPGATAVLEAADKGYGSSSSGAGSPYPPLANATPFAAGVGASTSAATGRLARTSLPSSGGSMTARVAHHTQNAHHVHKAHHDLESLYGGTAAASGAGSSLPGSPSTTTAAASAAHRTLASRGGTSSVQQRHHQQPHLHPHPHEPQQGSRALPHTLPDRASCPPVGAPFAWATSPAASPRSRIAAVTNDRCGGGGGSSSSTSGAAGAYGVPYGSNTGASEPLPPPLCAPVHPPSSPSALAASRARRQSTGSSAWQQQQQQQEQSPSSPQRQQQQQSQLQQLLLQQHHDYASPPSNPLTPRVAGGGRGHAPPSPLQQQHLQPHSLLEQELQLASPRNGGSGASLRPRGRRITQLETDEVGGPAAQWLGEGVGGLPGGGPESWMVVEDLDVHASGLSGRGRAVGRVVGTGMDMGMTSMPGSADVPGNPFGRR